MTDAIEPTQPDNWRKHVLIAAALGLGTFVLYVLPLFTSRAIYETPEARIGVVAREMIERDNYIEPTLAGKTRLNKPPLPYYMAVVVTKALASNKAPDLNTLRIATLLPQAFFGALAVFIVALFGMSVFGTTSGILSGAILGFSVMPMRYAQTGYPDISLMCGCTATACASAWIICRPKPGVLSAIGLGVGIAGAVLIKEPILALILPAPVVIECALRWKLNWRKVALFALGGVVAVAIVAPWYLLVWKTVPNGLQILIDERFHIWREGHDTKNRLYYFEQILGAFLPWTPAMLVFVPLAALRGGLLKLPPTDTAEGLAKASFRYMLLTGLIAFAGFYSQAKEQGYYLLPVLPALALASGYAISRCRPFLSESLAGVMHIVLAAGMGIFICIIPRFDQSVTWPLTITVGILFFVLQMICVRQWKNGHGVHAALWASVAAFVALTLSAPLLSARSHRKLGPIETDTAQLRKELDTMGSDVRVYAWGNPLPLMNYYLMRPVSNQKDLQLEIRQEKDPSAVVTVKRVLVATPKWIAGSGLEKYLPADAKPDDNSKLIALPLPSGAELLKTMKTPEHAPPEDDEG